jgi:hypothetical protein
MIERYDIDGSIIDSCRYDCRFHEPVDIQN